MRYLLDTHAFLWWDTNSAKLSSHVFNLMQDKNNTLYLSLVSIWEMQIKSQLGKLKLPDNLETIIDRQQRENRIQLLAIGTQHVFALTGLPNHHKDPFDRLLIAQARVENLSLITRDAKIATYPVTVVW